jgi:hypothetical protein
MATAEFVTDQPDGATAYQFEPGISTPVLTAPQVLPSEQLKQGPAHGSLSVVFLSGALNPRPDVVKFAAVRDPRLRVVKAIPLDVSVEESHFVVSWPETNEFGTGDTLSGALDDFAASVRELYHELFSPNANLGPDLERVRQTLAEYIQPRK